MSKVFHMTLVGKKSLDQELSQLIKVDRENIKKAIQEARELGDLKENAEYHAAKEKQSQLEGRIAEIQNQLNHAEVVDVSKVNSNKIVFGARVKLFDAEKDKHLSYQIVGVEEAKESGKISYLSPLGKALIGKEAGDTIIFQAPRGEVEYEIEDVEYS